MADIPTPQPYPQTGYPPQPPAPPGRSHTGLIIALILGVVALALVAVVGLAALGATSGGGSPSDRAAAYIQAYYDNDKGKVLSLIVPAERRLIDEDLWNECGYDRLDTNADGIDPDDPDAEIETINADPEGVWFGHVPGDGGREYELVDTVVRATSADGDFDEFDITMVKDDGAWYVRLDDTVVYGSLDQPCE